MTLTVLQVRKNTPHFEDRRFRKQLRPALNVHIGNSSSKHCAGRVDVLICRPNATICGESCSLPHGIQGGRAVEEKISDNQV